MAPSNQLRQGILYAIRLLAVTKRSTEELANRLALKGYPTGVIEEILTRLKHQGVLNDWKLVQQTVDHAIGVRRWGKRRIRFALEAKGLDSALVEEALARDPLEAEHTRALELARERWQKWAAVGVKKRQKKLYDFLVHRGYSYDLCRQIASRMTKDSDEGF